MVQKDMLEFNSRNISNIGNYFFREYSVNNSTIGFNKKKQNIIHILKPPLN